jgi:hypothetical protein
MSDTEHEPAEEWAVLDLMGRTRTAGRLTEVKRAGKDYHRLYIPPINGHQARTIDYSPDAVYSIEPVDEETARMVAAMHQPPEPVTEWSARRLLGVGTSQLALGAPDPDEAAEEERAEGMATTLSVKDDDEDLDGEEEAEYRAMRGGPPF